MRTFLSLFGKSPFTPLLAHMEKVVECVHKLPALFKAVEESDQAAVEQITKVISKLEHNADLAKNNIRNQLPKGLFLAIDRGSLLTILALQDSIADKAEDIAVLMTLKPLTLLDQFKEKFQEFLSKNIEACDLVALIIQELHELLESSFGGHETEKVKKMVEAVAYKEHEVDLIQRELLKHLIQAEDKMSYTTFYLWQKTIATVGDISNLSENLANRIRMTLESK